MRHKKPPVFAAKPTTSVATVASTPPALTAKSPSAGKHLTPNQISSLRLKVHDIVNDNLDQARLVLSGKADWSNSQIRLFTALLGKVVPDLQHKTLTTGDDKPVTQLTRSELEEIVRAGMRPRSKPSDPIIDVDPEAVPEVAEDDPEDSDAPLEDEPDEGAPAS